MLDTKRSEARSLLFLALPALVAITATVAVFCFGKKKKGHDQNPKSA